MERESTSRRDVLRLGVATAVAACAGCKLIGSRKADVVAEPQEGMLELSEDDSAQLLADEASLLIQPIGEDEKVLLVHAGEGRLFAVGASCTHMGCEVKYAPDEDRIVCPCHGSQFGLDGGNLKGPAQRPLPRYEIRNDGGRIRVDLNQPLA